MLVEAKLKYVKRLIYLRIMIDRIFFSSRNQKWKIMILQYCGLKGEARIFVGPRTMIAGHFTRQLPFYICFENKGTVKIPRIPQG